MKGAIRSSVFCLMLLTGFVASAEGDQPVSAEDGAKRLVGLDERIRAMRADLGEVALGYEVPLGRELGRVERRLREAEIQSLLGDHLRASILLFDVVERDEFKGTPGYLEAKFLLAESLRRCGQTYAAKQYYLELAQVVRGKRLAQTTLGMLDIASRTGDFANVEGLVRRVKAEGAGTYGAQIDFAFGKALFKGASDDVTRLTQALQLFSSVPANLSVSAPAAYYSGVTRVRMGDLEGALPEFQKTERFARSHPDTERVKELATLSKGRIYQEQGQTAMALESYQAISQDSIYFSDVLFEVAWVYVRAATDEKDEAKQKTLLESALDAVELLLVIAPKSHLYPRAKLLQGNLQIRLGASESAYGTFQSIIGRFDDSVVDMRSALDDTRSARAFFDQLIKTDQNDITGADLVPSVVAHIAMEDVEIRRAVVMRESLNESRSELEDAKGMVGTLEAALRSEQRFNMFPGLRKVRVKALTVQNRLLASEKLLLDVEKDLVSPYLDEASRVQINQAHGDLQAIEKDIVDLPLDDQQVAGRQEEVKGQYEAVALRAFTMLERVRTMQAQLHAIRHWTQSQGLVLEGKEKEINENRMASAEAEVARLEVALGSIQDEIDRAALLSKGDAGWARAERLRTTLYEAVDKELAILKRGRGRASLSILQVVERVDGNRLALRELERRLVTLQSRLERAVQVRVDDVRGRVLAELRTIQSELGEQAQLVSAADGLLEPLAQRTVNTVGQELEGFVVQADLGILDVAWARKRERTGEVTNLVRDLRRRNRELEENFGEVLLNEE